MAAPGRPLPRSGGGSGSSLPSASAAGAAGARLVQRSLSMANHYSQGWAGLAWQQLAAGLAAVQAYVGSWGFSGGGSLAAGVGGGAPPVTVRAAVRAALAAVVLYALYAERQAIRRWVPGGIKVGSGGWVVGKSRYSVRVAGCATLFA